MRLVVVVMIFAASALTAEASEVGLRFNNSLTSHGLFDCDWTGEGKLISASYFFQPLSGRFAENVFIAVGSGRYFTKDFDSHSFFILEGAPGVQVQTGPVRLRFSQGVAFFNGSGSPIQFATHFEIDLVDPKTGLSIGLERTHYSTGISGAESGGYNMTGLTAGLAL